MTRYRYGRAWNTKSWRLGHPMGEDEARRRFSDGAEDDWFTVAAFGEDVPLDGIPDYTMEIVPGESISK